jgi:hypothetical protein
MGNRSALGDLGEDGVAKKMPGFPGVSADLSGGTTRLELATSAVTEQRSNQLNYVPARD